MLCSAFNSRCKEIVLSTIFRAVSSNPRISSGVFPVFFVFRQAGDQRLFFSADQYPSLIPFTRSHVNRSIFSPFFHADTLYIFDILPDQTFFRSCSYALYSAGLHPTICDICIIVRPYIFPQRCYLSRIHSKPTVIFLDLHHLLASLDSAPEVSIHRASFVFSQS